MFGFMDKKTVGYTMAEVLLVLLIFSIMMLSLPPIAKKMYKTDTMSKKHGRFECYYNKLGVLTQYRVVDGEDPIIEPAPNGICEFAPPSNSIYTMIHAVGGGGAGYNLNAPLADAADITATSYVSLSSAALWPEWFRYIMDNRASLGLAFDSNSYEIKKFFKSQSIPYGVSGSAGEKVSMFFPRLRNVTIYARPGAGGQTVTSGQGNNGGNTLVWFKYTGEADMTEVINAAGGQGGNILARYSAALAGGDSTDFGVGKFTAVGMHSSNFEDVLEDTEANTKTHINDDDNWGGTNRAGWGGSGAYYYVNSGSGKFWYLINSYQMKADSDILTARIDRWYVVTDKIKNYFYRRDGASGECTVGSGSVVTDGMCKEIYEGNNRQYKCYIGRLNNTALMAPVIYSNGVFSGVPSYYTGCTLDETNLKINCTSKTVTNSIQTCQYNGSAFTCPNGEQNSSNNICGARSGGNGAVVILW